MSHHYHAIVWIDHHEARIFEFNEEEADKAVVKPKHPVKHLHTKGGSLSSWRAPEDKAYFKSVADHLKPVHEILIVGPANAKLAFVKYLHDQERGISDKVVGAFCPQLFQKRRSHVAANGLMVRGVSRQAARSGDQACMSAAPDRLALTGDGPLFC